MKKIVFLCLFFCGFLIAKDLEQIYLQSGVQAVVEELEKNLKTKEYWDKFLANKDLRYGYYDEDIFITVVDKTAKKLDLLFYSDGNLTDKFSQNIITGLMGDKEKQGDLKTPVGVYDITRRFDPGDPYYGPVAFSLSYPNLYDKLRDKTGNGIWIHGFPKNGEDRMDENSTRGCVVLKNDYLLQYEKIIQDNGGVVLINENGKVVANNQDIALILAQIFAWKHAWDKSDLNTYLDFYDSSFRRFDGMRIKEFSAMKRNIFSKQEEKIIKFSNFHITPYPSEEKQRFRVTFTENYATKSYKFDGTKTLIVKLENQKMKILAER